MNRRYQLSLLNLLLLITTGLSMLGWAVDHVYVASKCRNESGKVREIIMTCTALSARCQMLEKSLPLAEEHRAEIVDSLRLHHATRSAIAASNESQYVTASSEGALAAADLGKSPGQFSLVLAALAEAMTVPERFPNTDHFSIGDDASLSMSRFGADAIPYLCGLLYSPDLQTRARAVDCLTEMCRSQFGRGLTQNQVGALHRAIGDAANSEPDVPTKARLVRLQSALSRQSLVTPKGKERAPAANPPKK